jgi:hypothetical protein
MSLTESIEKHLAFCREATEKYVLEMDAAFQSSVWKECLTKATGEVADALVATQNLTEIKNALVESGAYSRALRFLLGPPLSQDQFLLACPKWSKTSEKTGRSLKEEVAAEFEETFEQWRDPLRTESLSTESARLKAIYSTAIMIAQTEFATQKRMRLATAQEQGATELLENMGFRKIELGVVDQAGALAVGEFAQATQFATADGSSHEVDIAVGLSKKRILALECKVSNDKTNSVKRINDVLKKADAWKKQWGRTVVTGALLQGVFSDKEPRRLLEAEVELFWSHQLGLFEQWIASETS